MMKCKVYLFVRYFLCLSRPTHVFLTRRSLLIYHSIAKGLRKLQTDCKVRCTLA